MKKTLIAGIIATMFILTACGKQVQTSKYESFAQCLTDEGVKMYGAYWCPHCQRQKEMFDGAFDNATYVECSLPNRQGQTQVCKMEGISTYPTWEFSDGSRVEGVIQLQRLSNLTGCPLPQ